MCLPTKVPLSLLLGYQYIGYRMASYLINWWTCTLQNLPMKISTSRY